MEQNSILFQKDGKYFLQLDCENAKELSLKWDDKTYSFAKDGEKWILELPFSTAVNYVQICVDGQEVLIVENLMLDLHLQYALHTTSFTEQPLSDKSLSRFRSRCYSYETVHGVDLYHDCVNYMCCRT